VLFSPFKHKTLHYNNLDFVSFLLLLFWGFFCLFVFLSERIYSLQKCKKKKVKNK